MAGAALSSIKMTCTQVLELLQSSVARHVRVITPSCAHAPATVTSVYVIVGVGSQLSVAEAVPVAGGSVLAVHKTVRFAGHMITGGVSSRTMMTCRHVLELAQSSVARQVRFRMNCCGPPVEIVTSVKEIVGVASQISVAVAVPVLTGNVPLAHMIVMFGGHVMSGGALSSMIIFWMQVLELLQSSVAFQVRLMVFSCGHAPPVVTSENVIVGVASHISVAVAVPVLTGKVLAMQDMVTLVGHVMFGGTLSVSVII